ncbi:unnamed protein product [Amaranthus hypochondriacus]
MLANNREALSGPAAAALAQRVNGVPQQNRPLHQQASQGGQALKQHTIQQLLHDYSGNKSTGQQKTFGGQNMNPNVTITGLGYGKNDTPATPAAGGRGPIVDSIMKHRKCHQICI